MQEKVQLTAKEIQAEIEAKKPDQTSNRHYSSLKLCKELLFSCSQVCKSPGLPSLSALLTKHEFLLVMKAMGYIASAELNELPEGEACLVSKMWNVLVESHVGEGEVTNLNALKRFVFVVEGLPLNGESKKKLKSLASETVEE